MSERTIELSRQGLSARLWPAERTQRGVLLVSHGLGEHSGRYAAAAREWSAAGWTVLAPDHYGHGRSPGPRGHVPDWRWLGQGILEACDWADVQLDAGPRALLGHSLGGCVALEVALDHPERLDTLILSAPALGLLPAAWWRRLAARALRHVWPGLRVSTGIRIESLTRDPDEARATVADPLWHTLCSPALGAALFEHAAAALRRADSLTLPLLVLHGDADPIVPLASSRALVAAVRHEQKRLVVHEGARHELLHDLQRREAIAEIQRALRDLAAGKGLR